MFGVPGYESAGSILWVGCGHSSIQAPNQQDLAVTCYQPVDAWVIKFNQRKPSAPDRTRTCYLQIRNLALYPDELRELGNAA